MILFLLLVDAPLLHFIRDSGGKTCLTATEARYLKVSLVAHLLVPMSFLAKWVVRWACRMRRKDQTQACQDAEFFDLRAGTLSAPPPRDDLHPEGTWVAPVQPRVGGRASVVPLEMPKWNYGGGSSGSGGGGSGGGGSGSGGSGGSGSSMIPAAEVGMVRRQVRLAALEEEVAALRRELGMVMTSTAVAAQATPRAM